MKTKLIPQLTLLLFFTLLFSISSAQSPHRPQVTTWMAFWDWDRSFTEMTTYPGLFTEVLPFWYDMDSTGNLKSAQGIPEMLKAKKLKFSHRKFVQYCHKNGIKVIPLISNAFQSERVSQVVNNPVLRKRHVKNLVSLTQKYNYDGVDIDYEGLKREDRDAFSLFMTELSTALHKKGKLLSVAVHAKFSEPGDWDSQIAHNYVALGKVCDRVRIMAYDHHYSGGAPGCIAPVDWVEKITQFAVTVIPPEKLYMGVATYGLDWGAPKEKEAMWTTATKLIKENNITPTWDTTAQEWWFTYQDPSTYSQRTVWYHDLRVFESRWEMANKYQLGGITFWRLGGIDPSILKYLSEYKPTQK